MTDYSASVTADFSGYTNSTQQAIALTKEFTAANEGMIGMVGRTGTRAIIAFNDALGLSGKIMKANVSEAANYQQMLGRVSASARAAGKDVGETQRMTMGIARSLTGNIASAESTINSIISSGETRTRQIQKQAKAIVELGAATGESGTVLADNIRTLQRAYGYMPDADRITALGDSVVSTSKKFGASATDVTAFSKSISPFAKQVGLAQTSLVGFATAFARVGEDGFRAANVFSKVLADIDLAAREGSPTLGVYAEAMGLTYKQAEKLATSNPTEFLIKFTEALDEQGDTAIRTLQALGLEGVRSQKALAALTSSGDLRDIIAEAQASYGSGTAADAAQEQLKGLNEQTAKLEESLRQVVAGSGAPFLDWLTTVAGVSTKAADALAGLVNSSGFQAIAGTAVGGMAAAGIGSKLLGGMYTATSLGSLLPMLSRPLSGAGQFIAANRRNIGLAGAGGMAAGMVMDNQSMSTLGMLAMGAAGLAGPEMFGKVRTGFEFLTRDPRTLARTPFTEWGTDHGRPWRMANLEMAGGVFKPTGSQDQMATLLKYMKESGNFSKEQLKETKRAFNLLTPEGRVFGAAELAKLNDRIASGRIDPGRVTESMIKVVSEAPEQTAGMRARAMGRSVAGFGGAMAMGFPTQAGALLGTMASNPVAWGVGAALAGVAGVAYVKNRSDNLSESIRAGVLQPSEEVAAGYGLIAPKFNGLAAATDSLTSSFEGLVDIFASGRLPTLNELSNIDRTGEPSTELTLQNRRFLWQTTGSQLTGASAVTEAFGAYGTQFDKQFMAAYATDLGRMGKTNDEIRIALEAVQAASSDNTKILDTAMTAYQETMRGPVQQLTMGYLNNGKAVEAIERWVADTENQMTPQQQAAEIYKAIGKAAPGMPQWELDRLLGDVSKIKGLETYTAPTIVNAGNRLNDPEAQRRAAEANAAAVSAWTAQYVTNAPGLDVALLQKAFSLPEFQGQMPRAMAAEAARVEAGGGKTGMAIERATEEFTTALKEYKADQVAQNTTNAQAVAGAIIDYSSGNLSDASRRAREMQFSATPESPAGVITAQVQAEIDYQRGLESMGRSDFANTQSALKSAVTKKLDADKYLKDNSASAAAQQAAQEANDELKQAYAEQISVMQNFLRARRALDKANQYAIEDYNEAVSNANEDFRIAQDRAQEQYDNQQRYAREDFYTSMARMAEDYNTSMARSERDYLKQRQRIYEDHDTAMARRAEDAAKAMYDPFTRMSLEQTWSGGGLLTNLRQQQEAFDKQVANLEAARAAGVEQSTIDMLGLNDPSKGQQLERLLRDINRGGVDVGELNKVAAERTATAGVLFGAENDMGARRQEEDYRKQLDRMTEDRKKWLEDAAADYEKARRRAAKDFDKAMRRAQEGFDLSMRYMEESQELSLKRMEKAHNKQLKRAEEQFEMTFEAMSSDYEKLAAATTKALEGESVAWGNVISNGMDDMRKVFTDKSNGIDVIMSDALGKQLKEKYGADGKMVSSWTALLNMLINATGGDSSGAAWTSGMPASEYRGDLAVTGGRGRITQWYGKRNSDYAAGYHTGIDVGAPKNTPVYSTVIGKVVQAGYDSKYGNRVLIDVDDSNVGLLYGHMSAIGVRRGDKVRVGTAIGKVGSTGNSTGYHLHLEARREDRDGTYPYSSNFNPAAYLWTGGITQGRAAVVGENVYPEAVIPLNERGIDVLAQVFDKAFGQALLNQALTGGGTPMRTSITTITEDHSVNINGPIHVVSTDPERVGRELERKARDAAIIQPSRRS